MQLLYFKSLRNFQLWEYFVSHSQLLIRSPKTSDSEKNVDILFSGVKYISLPCSFSSRDGLVLQEGSQVDLLSFTSLTSFPDAENRLFWLICGESKHVVIADVCEISEKDGGFMENSIKRPWE